ncbi:unnamed protein product [Schistocephalus solidus]|uniref:40S ribosomal protein S21 n=1 Tax=Schistocephalus solidus TaxID=70667 RepID=A0A183TMW9_SCHSO|nr:unnamed protein product [Schistocephalus solidus]
MQNEAGEFVDMYVPRRCDVSNQLIGAKDHASISIRLAEVDHNTGRMTGKCKVFNISGQVRAMGESYVDAFNSGLNGFGNDLKMAIQSSSSKFRLGVHRGYVCTFVVNFRLLISQPRLHN